MYCPRLKRSFSFPRHAEEIVATGIVAPEFAPAWARNRNQLWRRNEKHNKRKDARVAIRGILSIPHRLSANRAVIVAVVTELCRSIVGRFNVAIDYAIHAPSLENDKRNYHVHLVITTSTLSVDGFGTKQRYFDTKALRKSGSSEANAESFASLVRRWWETILNAALEFIGERVRVCRHSRAHQFRERLRMFDLEAASELEGEPLAYLGKERYETQRAAGTLPHRHISRSGLKSGSAGVSDAMTGRGRAADPELQRQIESLTECLDQWHAIDAAVAEPAPMGAAQRSRKNSGDRGEPRAVRARPRKRITAFASLPSSRILLVAGNPPNLERYAEMSVQSKAPEPSPTESGSRASSRIVDARSRKQITPFASLRSPRISMTTANPRWGRANGKQSKEDQRQARLRGEAKIAQTHGMAGTSWKDLHHHSDEEGRREQESSAGQSCVQPATQIIDTQYEPESPTSADDWEAPTSFDSPFRRSWKR